MDVVRGIYIVLESTIGPKPSYKVCYRVVDFIYSVIQLGVSRGRNNERYTNFDVI